MKLLDVPRNTLVRLLPDPETLSETIQVPPGAPELKVGDIIKFHHLDGMYSYCHKEGVDIPVHLVAWQEVEIV